MSGTTGEHHAGCSKSPTFSPTQPWRAKTRLVPVKAAASEEARRTLRYVEPLSDARTMLADFFSILLGSIACVNADIVKRQIGRPHMGLMTTLPQPHGDRKFFLAKDLRY